MKQARLVRHINKWRAIEYRFAQDAARAIRVYQDPGRPAAVDEFIEGCLATSRRARRRAADLEIRLSSGED